MDMDPGVLRQIALGTVPPGIAATAAFAAVWWRGRGGQGRAGGRDTGGKGGGENLPPLWRRIAVPLLLAGLYTGFHAFLFGGINIPPRESMDWLAVVAWVAAIGAVGNGLLAGARGRRMAIWAGALVWIPALLAIGWLAAGSLARRWDLADAASNIGMFAAAGIAAVIGAEALARRRPGASGVAAMVVVCAGASQVLVLAFSSLKYSQSAGLWAAFMGGAMVVAFFRSGLTVAHGAAGLAASMVMAAMYQGVLFTYTERAWVSVALVASSPVLAALGTLWARPQRGRGLRVLRWALPAMLAAIPAAAAVALALAGSGAGGAGGDYDY